MLSFNHQRHGYYACSEAQLINAEAEYGHLSLEAMHGVALERSDVDFTDVRSTSAMLIVFGEWVVL